MPPSGGMMTGDPNPMAGGGGPGGPMPDAGGGDPTGGGGGAPGGGLPPELAQMGLAGALMPQIMAQQQSDYYKKFLKQIGGILREFMRTQGISPKIIAKVGSSVTGLEAAAHMFDKERPGDAAPVESLLASSMMQNRPPMGGSPIPAGLAVQR